MSAPSIIVSAACTFPSGPTIGLADTAVRTQLLLLQRHPTYTNRAGNPVRASFFPVDMPFNAPRWAALATSVLKQLVANMTEGTSTQIASRPARLWLVLPDGAKQPDLPVDLAKTVTDAVHIEAFRWEQVTLCLGGHAAGIAALQDAHAALARDASTVAVVLGVESGLHHAALALLEMQSLLHGADRAYRGHFLSNSYGRIPGEGAAAIALTAGHAGDTPNDGWAMLLGAATADEPITHASNGVCVGAGLTQASRNAIAQAREHAPNLIGSVIADLNGEPYRADQFGFTVSRIAESFTPHWQRVTPPLASADLNAASAVAHVALAAYRLKRFPQINHHLVLSSSDDTLRAAAVLGHVGTPSDSGEIQAWRSPSM